MGARLAVDADAHLHLVLGQLEAGLAGGGDGAGLNGRAHGAHVVDDLLGHGLDGVQVCAGLGQGAGDLVDEHGARHAPAAHGVQAVLHGHVVVHDDLGHLDALVTGHVGGHLEVHHVAGVVLDDHQHTRVGGDGLDALEDLVGGGGGEHRAGHRRIQHALAHVAAVGGLMAAAAAADEGHLALLLIGADHHIAAVQLLHILGIGLDHALDHLILYLVNRVDELLHADTLLIIKMGK